MKNNNSSNQWFRIFKRSAQVEQYLICFHYAGASSTMFTDWIPHVAPGIQLCAVQLPGRGKRISEELFTDMDSVISALAENIQPLMNKPISFFGHSMGALVAFELAHRLEKQFGTTIEHLIVSGRSGPTSEYRSGETKAYQLPHDEFVEELKRLNGTPESALQHAELMALSIPILRADFQIAETYQYTHRTPLRCPITVLAGEVDKTIKKPQDLSQWKNETEEACNVHVMPGDHFFIETHKDLVVETINKCLSASCIAV